MWKQLKNHIKTDGVHAEDHLNPNVETPGEYTGNHTFVCVCVCVCVTVVK